MLIRLARADFLQRTRSYQYLMTIAVTLLAGVWFVPGRSANYTTLMVDGYRGIYNSSWIGAVFAILAGSMISLLGFYVVKGSIEEDRLSHIGEIIASAPISTFTFLIAKMLSNCAVLLSILSFLFIDAVAMQLLRGENRSIQLWQIAEPLIIIVVPVIALVAALAVLFDVLPILRTGLGNIAYFFGWVAFLSLPEALTFKKTPAWLDVLGVGTILQQIHTSVASLRLPYRSHEINFGATLARAHTFTWHGFTWPPQYIADRAAWLLGAIAIVALAALFFDRFSTAPRSVESPLRGSLRERGANAFEKATRPLANLCFRSAFGRLVLAEIRLMLQGLSAWWWLIAVALWLGTLLVPNGAQSIILSLAWIWAILIWSQMGSRERACGTEQMMFSTVHPLRRQFLALWFAGVLLACALGSGAMAHAFATGDLHRAIGIVVGAIFLPTFALACGSIAQSPRLFEVAYMVLWYAGPMNHIASLDYTSAVAARSFAVATLVLFALAFTARRLRLQLL